MKRKFIFLIMLLTLIGGVKFNVLNAQEQWYRIKALRYQGAGGWGSTTNYDFTTDMYLNINNYDAHADGPIGGVSVASYSESFDQIFTLEDNGDGTYYIKSASGKYIYCQSWNVDALDTKSPIGFEYVDANTFYMKNASKYFKVEYVSSASASACYPFCDHSNATYAATWVLEEATVAYTVNVSASSNEIWSDETVQLSATAINGAGNYTYNWSPATGLDDATSATPIFTPTAAGTYTFTCTATDANGDTTTSEEITITVKDASEKPKTRNIVFTLIDSYGDGWQNNYLTVVADDGTNEILRHSSGSTATYTLEITQESLVTVSFYAVNYYSQTYSEECSYTVRYEDGGLIHESGQMPTYSAGTVIPFEFTVESADPSVTIDLDPATIALGDVRLGDYWTEKEQKTEQFGVVVKYTTITEVSCDNEFFVVEYDEVNSLVNVGYNKNANVTGEQSGTVTITAENCDPVTVAVTATAYTATEPDAIEVYRTIEFDGKYSDTPTFTSLHDDYKLPGEVNEGSTPDAVYKFNLESEGLLTVNVTGTSGIAAIYKAEDLEGSGPSSDNNYEGVVTAPSEPALPTTFFYDFNTNLDDFTLVDADGDGHHWKLVDGTLASYSWENGAILYPNNYIYTIQAYSITANSKLTYKVQAANYPDHYAVVASEDGINFNILFEEDYLSYTQISREVDLKDYAGKNLYLGFRHFNCSNQYAVYIDDFQLTDGSSKTRESEPQINGVVYPVGTYYLVAAAEDEFTVSLSAETVPVPAAVVYTSPENETMEQANPKLTWKASEYATSYKVYLGTELPLTEYVEVETPSYKTENLQNNTKYYWSVTAVNNAGEKAGEVRSFVTPLNQVTELAATATELYPGETTTISWTAAEGATGYNVYVNDVKVKEELVTETSYELTELPHNINTGNAISVAAVHTLGESPKCEAVNVKMAGEFTLVVNVKDTEGNPLEGAAVSFNTESYYDEYNQAIDAVETLSTDANGQIKQVLPLPSVYDYYNNPVYAQMTVTVSKEYANDEYIHINSYTGVTNGEEYVQDVTLYYVAPQNVQTDKNYYIVGDDMTMTWDAVEGATGYNVYERGEWNYETNQYDYTLLTTEAITETTYTVELTEYAPVYGVVYAVTAVYTVGESPKAERYVYVTGNGSIKGVITDGTNPIAGLTFEISGTSAIGEEIIIVETDDNGAFDVSALEGTYTLTISHYDYEEYVMSSNIEVTYSNENDLGTIILTAKPTAEGISVTATADNDEYANVTWTGSYEKYNVYRMNMDSYPQEAELIAEGVTEETYQDTDWAELAEGTYQYGVSAFVEEQAQTRGVEVIFEEDFENCEIYYVPDGWNKITGNWRVTGSGYNNSTKSLWSQYVTSGSHYIVMPEINPANATMTFYYRNAPEGTNYDELKVCYSTSQDGPWTDFGTYVNSTWTQAEIPLDNIEANTIYIAFCMVAHYSSGIYIDDIVITSESSAVESQIVWSDPVVKQGPNTFLATEDSDWNNLNNWSNGSVPTAESNVVINAAAVISAQDAVAKNITIASGASVTVNAERTLTAQNIYNTLNSHSQLIINDGAQVIQNNEGVLATFNMGIVNPGDYGQEYDGWQFIAVPFTDAAFVDFTGFMATNYDLYKYDGASELEWNNHKDGVFDAEFVNGRGYLASHGEKETATIYGTLNSAKTHTYTVTYNADKDLANFHLLGNPFSFNMDWSNVVVNESVYNGFATVDPATGGYITATEGTIPVGDGFFVKVVDADPTISYGATRGSRNEKSEYINVVATGKQGSNNVIVKLDGAEEEGFAKLENINKNIADVYVKNNGKQFSILSYDENTTEVELFFDAKEMGNYTISIEPNGEFETVTLVDRFTGVETNMLLEDYNFTATSNDNTNRFIVKMVNGQQTTDNSQFVYQSGEELIFSIEGTVQIVDVLGRVVYHNEVANGDNRINVSNFNDGAYFVRVVNENGVKVQKIVL